MSAVSVDRLNELFSYDPETGIVTSKVNYMKWSIGQKIGHVHGSIGYLRVMVDRHKLYVHRVAFAIYHGVWPESGVDHVNGITSDNRICNIRSANQEKNARNTKLSKANKTGVKGVCFCNRRNKYIASIRANGTDMYLGGYETLDEASNVRKKYEEQLFGEFARKQ